MDHGRRPGLLRFRADLACFADPATWAGSLDTMTADRQQVDEQGSGWLPARTVKFFADGVVESGTAAMLEDCHDCPDSRGLPNGTATELAEAMIAVDSLGFECHIHAIGDAGVRMSLDAVEELHRRSGRRDRRTTIAHLQVTDPVDLPRFAQLGVIANFEPLWARPEERVDTGTALRASPAALSCPRTRLRRREPPLAGSTTQRVHEYHWIRGIGSGLRLRSGRIRRR